MIRRLRAKFICINMIIVSVMLFVIFGMLVYFTGEELERQSLNAMQNAPYERMIPDRPGNWDEAEIA